LLQQWPVLRHFLRRCWHAGACRMRLAARGAACRDASGSLGARGLCCRGTRARTARRWRDEAKAQGDDWNKLRAAHTLAGGSIDEIARAMMTSFLVQYQATMTMLQDAEVEDLPPSKRVQLLASLADAFTKTVAANKRVLPETSQLATALELLQFLMVFVQEKHPKHLAAFVEVLEPFGAEVERKFG